MTQHAFQTEVQQLLHLMIHSLYSEREVFLRELISNAADACDKLRIRSLTDGALLPSSETLQIEVLPDTAERRLVIRDNGIGMTLDDAIEHLGTIAKSGTKAFLTSLADGDARKNANLIGQFGVGFYSSFMVADQVVVESRAAGASAEQGVRWASSGDGTYTTEPVTLARRGTTITLHLKEDAKDFAEPWRLRTLIKKYSDYLPYPVMLPKEDPAKKDGEKIASEEKEQANAGQALWTRPKDQITDEQYAEFYRTVSHQWDEPATRLHVAVEGTLSFTSLLFIPTQRPMDLFERDHRGLSLYVRRVFVMDECKDLLPDWLRFVKGVVDSDDLPLNVSREILQQQDTVPKLRKQLVKRLCDHLLKLAQSSDAAEQKAWISIEETFGQVIREGIVSDHENKDRVARLARYRSTWTIATPSITAAVPPVLADGSTTVSDATAAVADGSADNAVRPTKTSLEDYVRRMPSTQPAIYVVAAPNLESAKGSPHAEAAVRKGYEVLFLIDPVDEWVVQHLDKFDGKDVVNLAKGDLASAEDKKELEEKSKRFEGFLGFCKEQLGDGVGSVQLTSALSDSPCRLVADPHAPSPQVEEMMRRMGQTVPPSKRTLELNPGHPLIQRLQALHSAEPSAAKLAGWVAVLRDQAVLAEGGRIADPASFAKKVQELLLTAAG
ncbi:chaperone protein HtpG [Planctomycetota bacterium]|nr:chaperone protein HtpG [Planctomycetota bacterium]